MVRAKSKKEGKEVSRQKKIYEKKKKSKQVSEQIKTTMTKRMKEKGKERFIRNQTPHILLGVSFPYHYTTEDVCMI